MKKKYRLIKESDFKEVFNNRTRVRADCLMCCYKKDESLDNIKVGIIIPKKKCKSAVKRNYLKRILRCFNPTKTLSKLPKYKCILMFTQKFFEIYDIDNLPIDSIRKTVKKIHSQLINLSNHA